jgi:hypothetical protein
MYHIAAQPSASWKLSAISTPFMGSVHTIRVSEAACQPHCCHHLIVAYTLLLLEPILFADPGF